MSSHLKKIITIINPASGTDVPILSLLNEVVQKEEIENEVLVTQKPDDAISYAKHAVKVKPQAVVVYGGDGTVVDVASVLYKTDIPIIILPGGTANVIAKELKIPVDLKQALSVLERKPKEVVMDVARCSNTPLFLRVEVGILADIVKSTSRELKDNLGIIAYPIAALKEASNATPSTYSLMMDGKEVVTEGVGLMVANVGNLGLTGVSYHSKMSCTDGLLDVLVLQSSDLKTLVELGSSALTGGKKPVALKHWQAKEVQVSIAPTQTIIRDDHPIEQASFTVSMERKKLRVLR